MVGPSTTHVFDTGNPAGELTQCQNCFVSENELEESGRKLLICSACKRSRYCSPECQNLHWRTHKPSCLINRRNLAGIESAVSSSGLQLAEVEGHYREWLREFRLTLYSAVFSAFDLEEYPENISRNLLTVELSPTFLPGQAVDPKRAFTAISVGVDLMADVPSGQPRQSLDAVLARVPELRRSDPTLLGVAIVLITILVDQEETQRLLRLVPLGINGANTGPPMPMNHNWEGDLMMRISNGDPYGRSPGQN